MRRKIGETEYTINPIPPYLTPSMLLYGRLANHPAETLAEAEKSEEQMRRIVVKVLEATVTPTPKKEDYSELFKTANALTTQVMNNLDREFFPGKRERPQTSPSGSMDSLSSESTSNDSTGHGRKSKRP